LPVEVVIVSLPIKLAENLWLVTGNPLPSLGSPDFIKGPEKLLGDNTVLVGRKNPLNPFNLLNTE